MRPPKETSGGSLGAGGAVGRILRVSSGVGLGYPGRYHHRATSEPRDVRDEVIERIVTVARPERIILFCRHASTVDLLCHGLVTKLLGETGQCDAIFFALRDARMEVSDDRFREVVERIGHDRAVQCRSLPRWARRVRHP